MCAIGPDVRGFWKGLLGSIVGTAPVRGFDVTGLSVDVACEVAHPDGTVPTGLERATRATELASTAAAQAIVDSGQNPESLCRAGAGIVIGTTMGEVGAIEAAYVGDPRHQVLRDGLVGGQDIIARRLAAQIGLPGPRWTLSNACAAGNYAIIKAAECIAQGHAEVMIAVGVDALSWVAYSGFHALRILARQRCQPFDRNREGLVLGEGAGALMLERAQAARQRGAVIYGEILGYGLSCDAHHIAQPDSCGAGAAAAMRRALANARISPDAVDYICAHGTGTRNNDRAEAMAIHDVFGPRAARLPTSSIKAQLGHTLGAATAIEAIACVLSLRDDVIPATCNFETLDPDCPLDVVPNTPREARINIILNNGYAFGGNNSSIVLKAYD